MAAKGFDLIGAQRRVFRSGLRPFERLVALALLDHWSRNRDTFPSVARLAEWTGISERSVKTCLAGLEAAGAIRVARVRGRPNIYDLTPLATLPTSAGAALDRGRSCTGAGAALVQELPPTSAGAAPELVQELPPKEPIEGTQEGTHIGAPHEPPPSKKPPKPKPQKATPKAKAKRWTFVPDDWHPTEAHRAKARELGVSLDEQLALFRAHEFRAPKTDADRAFHGWLTRAASWAPAPRGGGSGAPRVQMSVKEGWRPTVLDFGDDPEVTP